MLRNKKPMNELKNNLYSKTLANPFTVAGSVRNSVIYNSFHSPANFILFTLLSSSMGASIILNRVSRSSSSISLHRVAGALGFNSLNAQIHGGRISGTMFRGSPFDPLPLSCCFLWKKLKLCDIFHHRL